MLANDDANTNIWAGVGVCCEIKDGVGAVERALDCFLSEEISPPCEVARSLTRWRMWHEWMVTELSKKSFEASEVSSSWWVGLIRWGHRVGKGERIYLWGQYDMQEGAFHKVFASARDHVWKWGSIWELPWGIWLFSTKEVRPCMRWCPMRNQWKECRYQRGCPCPSPRVCPVPGRECWYPSCNRKRGCCEETEGKIWRGHEWERWDLRQTALVNHWTWGLLWTRVCPHHGAALYWWQY